MSDDVVHGSGGRLLVGEVTGVDHPAFVLPTGTVTFLLTDVEGSSRRWEEAAGAMAVAVPRHYAILEEAIAAHGGVRPVEQGEGDSVVGAFSRASDAVAAALDAQRALTAEGWPEGADLRVRMAVHTGEAQLRDEGNYFGRTVIRCARLRAVGHGGQILVSDATAALVADRLSGDAGLVDLGTHRLKDLARPERVWQLTHPQLPPTFPVLRSLDAFRHNLPVQLTPLVGRGGEVATLGALLGTERLVTLTGSGGVGKTRLALAVAADVVDRFSGVWLVELAGVTDSGGVAAAALAAMGVPQSPGVSVLDQLVGELADGRCLVVLDNCEHLVGACAELVAAVLAANPAVVVLATSREPLGVPGEVLWRVPSLRVPSPEATLAVAVLSQYDAVRLFIDCARRARPSFTVSDANAPAVAQICHRLDGIPLALELAAARCRQMSVERIAADLDDRFRFLTGGSRTVLPRHQTLASSIDWSHDRLDEAEKTVFRRLGVFAGPFPLEAAEAIAADPADIESVEVFDVLSRLVDKSLVQVADGLDGQPRYRLLETLRAYAVTQQREIGELPTLRRSHALWWLGWLDERFAVIHTDTAGELVEGFNDNLKAALDWSLDEPAIGLRLLSAVARPWLTLGRPSDAMDAVDRLLTDENADQYRPEWVAAANAVAVLVSTARSFRFMVSLMKTTEQLALSIHDAYQAAHAAFLTFSDLTVELCTAVRDMAHDRQDLLVECSAILHLAQVGGMADPVDAAGRLGADGFLSACRDSSFLNDLADRARAHVALTTGDFARCMELSRRLASGRLTAMVSMGVGLLTTAGLMAADETALEFAVRISEELLRKMPGTAPDADLAAHWLHLVRGGASEVTYDLYTVYHEQAAREAIDAGAVDEAVAAARQYRQPNAEGHAVLASIEAAATGDEDRWHDALRLAVDHGFRPIAADALEALAVIASGSESWAECLRLAAAAQRLRDEITYRWRFGFEQTALDSAVSAARHGLGAEAADAATAEGSALDWRQASTYAKRARGERKRPRHGWASLTPTEEQVVMLVAEGLTNPQIAGRLLMGRATVKTHLDHIFVKTGTHTRAELAAEQTRRESTRRATPPKP